MSPPDQQTRERKVIIQPDHNLPVWLLEAVTRRQILRRLAVGAAALSVPTLLAKFEHMGSAAAAMGGTLTWGKPLESKEFDPHTAILGSSWQILYLSYEGLTTIGDRMDVRPWLAERWEQPSPSTYAFYLRNDVKFSNGRPMTADDVVGSLRRVIDPELASWWASQMGSIKSIVAVDEHTVRLDLNEPFTPLLHSLSATMAAILPMKELESGEFDPNKDKFLGTGPFRVMEHQQDDHWTFERNSYYWRDGFPKLDRVIVRVMTDDSARIAALRDGSVDIANFENTDAPKLLSGISNVGVVEQEAADFYTLGLNPLWPESIFKDVRLRQAVALAIDREQIRDLALSGQGRVTGFSPVVFEAGCDISKLPSYRRNLDRARQLLEEAGVGKGATFEMLVQSGQTFQRIAQVIQQQVAEIGLEADLKVMDEGVWVKRVFVDGTFEASPFWWGAYTDPGMVVAWWDPDLAGFTKPYVEKNPQLVQPIRAQRGTPDGAERARLIQQACLLADQDAQMIPLVTRWVTVGYRTDRVNVELQDLEGFQNTLRHVQEFMRF